MVLLTLQLMSSCNQALAFMYFWRWLIVAQPIWTNPRLHFENPELSDPLSVPSQ